MVAFLFAVNMSFLEDPQHPITIPLHKSNQLLKEGYFGRGDKLGSSRPARVSGAGPITYRGWIYHQMARWGRYYQIKFTTPSPTAGIGGLKIGDVILVEVDRLDGNLCVRLRIHKEKKFPPQPEQSASKRQNHPFQQRGNAKYYVDCLRDLLPELKFGESRDGGFFQAPPKAIVCAYLVPSRDFLLIFLRLPLQDDPRLKSTQEFHQLAKRFPTVFTFWNRSDLLPAMDLIKRSAKL